MISQIEAFTSTKHIYSEKTFEALTKLVLMNGLKGVSAHGCFLDSLKFLKVRPETYITVDFPYCQHGMMARQAIIESYLNQYGSIIHGFNITPMTHYLVDDNLGHIQKDIESISELVCLKHKKKLRLFINFAVYEEQQTLQKIIDNVQSLGIDELILGSSLAKADQVTDVLEMIAAMESSLNIPYSFFGKLSSVDEINNILNFFDFQSILLPPTILLRILGV